MSHAIDTSASPTRGFNAASAIPSDQATSQTLEGDSAPHAGFQDQAPSSMETKSTQEDQEIEMDADEVDLKEKIQDFDWAGLEEEQYDQYCKEVNEEQKICEDFNDMIDVGSLHLVLKVSTKDDLTAAFITVLWAMGSYRPKARG